jgi:hypothetical protein
MLNYCYMCKEEKTHVFFFKDKYRTSGFANRCKKCCRTYTKDMQLKHPEIYRRAWVKWYAKNKLSVKERSKEYKKDKVRNTAHNMVKEAIRSGVLVRKPCEVCSGTKLVDAHHDDYSKPLNVRWLCRRHHQRHHYENRPVKT